MFLKCCTQYVSKLGKFSSDNRTGKGQFSFQSQRKARPKQCSKFSKLGFNSTCIENIHVQAGFRKSRGTKDQIANIPWIIDKAREFQENIYFCFIDYAKD